MVPFSAIVFDVLSDRPSKMPPSKRHDPVQAFASNRKHESVGANAFRFGLFGGNLNTFTPRLSCGHGSAQIPGSHASPRLANREKTLAFTTILADPL